MYAVLSSAEQCADIFPQGELLEFNLGERARLESTAYNSSIPFDDVFNGMRRRLILLRHESLYSETDSEVVVCDHNTRQIIPDAPVFSEMQDPYYLGRFMGEDDQLYHVIGGVKITVVDDKVTSWQDVFFRYKNSIMELANRSREPEPWLVGVPKWKDTRAVQLLGGIAVMPRPQGEFGGAGSIGTFETKHLGTFEKDLYRYAAAQDEATLIYGLFGEGRWGGPNQLRAIANTIVVNGHTGWRGADLLKYYESMQFTFDWTSKKVQSYVGSVATADHFMTMEPKPGHELGKVHFTAGRVPCNDGSGDEWLYGGVQDRAVGRLRIPGIR